MADAPIATGVPGHPTPMGVFSVIDKERYHDSNIYSGAPMPYMQRITGRAWRCTRVRIWATRLARLHPHAAGVRFAAVGASHLGARVIIARPELTPHDFADPHLFVHMETSQPAPGPVAATPGAPKCEVRRRPYDSDHDYGTPPPRRFRGEIDAASRRTAPRTSNGASS